MRVNKSPPGPHETRDILFLQIIGVMPIGPAFKHASPPPPRPEDPYDVDSVEEIGLIGLCRINRPSLRPPQ